jgi:hypothetical protein
MTSSRKGLKRVGFRRYVVGRFAIDRERPNLFFVRPISFPRVAGFFCQEFRRLRDARAYAEQEAGMG